MTSQIKNFRLVFITAISFVFVLSIFSYIKIKDLIDTSALVTTTSQVTLELEKVIGSLKDAESGQRGYLITHNDAFMESFTSALKEYRKHIRNVKQLTKDNPEHKKNLESLELLAHRRDAHFYKLLDIDKFRPPTDEELLTGQAIMDSLRAEVNLMIALENLLLKERSEDFYEQTILAPVILVVFSIITFMVLIIFFLKSNKSLEESEKLKAEAIRQAVKIEKSKKKQESEKRFRELVEQAPVAICVLRGEDFVVEIANHKQLELWGKAKEEVMNRPVSEAIPEMKGKGFENVLNNIVTTGKPFIATEQEVTLIRNGKKELVYVSVVCEPIRDEHELNGVISIATDVTQQVTLRNKIEESESRYRSLADNTPIFSFIVEPKPEASISYWNKTWLEYTGQTFEDAIGRAWDGIIHPDDLQIVNDIYVSAFEKRESYFIPGIRVKRHDGMYRWHLFTGNPRFLPDGDFIGYIGVGFDIHQQKLAENKLAYRTAILEAHNQASVDGILLVDAKGKIISYNQRFIDIWNMPQDIVDRKDDEVALTFAKSQLNHPQKFIEKVKYMYEHPTHTCLDELEFSDGKIVERNGYPVIGEDGTYYAWSWTFKDVTRQRQIEKEIKESEERFRTLAQSLPQLVWVTDAQGKAEFYSGRWKEYTGMECGSETVWREIVHPEDYDRINAAWIQSLKTGEFYKGEVRLRNKEGEYRWHTVNGNPVFKKGRQISKWVGAFTDIHEQKISEKKKDEFLSIASHEMKTPLTTAKAYLQMMELSLDEKNSDENLFVKKANQSVNRLDELISELLDVSRIQFGKLNYNITRFDFNSMIDSTIEDIQLTSPMHTIIKSGQGVGEITGDKQRLQQVVINLLNNAIKYSPGEKYVFVSIAQEDGFVKVSVRDQGIGMAPDGIKKIFDKYHRIEEHAVQYQGLGIGLFISHEIIHRHSGSLWAESELGKGSTFYFTLPLNNS
jgi:PAS domain S-box-containing protein